MTSAAPGLPADVSMFSATNESSIKPTCTSPGADGELFLVTVVFRSVPTTIAAPPEFEAKMPSNEES